jgi:hypothetical protein
MEILCFTPGTIFFVDPSKVGGHFTNINFDPATSTVDLVDEKLALATNLGIKGYYMANKVEHIIERGKYEVLVDGIYVYDGVPRPVLSMGGKSLTDLHRAMAQMLYGKAANYSGRQLELFNAVHQMYANVYNQSFGGRSPDKDVNAIRNTERALSRLLFGGTEYGKTAVTKGMTAAQQAALMRGAQRHQLSRVQ